MFHLFLCKIHRRTSYSSVKKYYKLIINNNISRRYCWNFKIVNESNMQYQLKLSINFQIFMDMKYFDEVFLYDYKFLTVIYIFLRRFENSLINYNASTISKNTFIHVCY